MKVSLQKQSGILGLEENFSILESIDSKGFFVYKIKYKVDVDKALSNNALTVKISASTKPDNKQEKKTFIDFDPETMISNILLKSSQNKDSSRASKSDIILTITSDITKRIPNNKASSVDKTTKTKSMKLVSVEEINSQNLVVPVLQTTLASNIVNNISALQVRDASYNLLQNRIDPATVAIRNNIITNSNQLLSGIRQATQPSLLNTSIDARQLSNSVIAGSATTISTQYVLSNQDLIPVLTETISAFIEIEETMNIPINSLTENEFYFIFKLINGSGVEIEVLNGLVNHSKNLSILNIPSIPPMVKEVVVNDIGRNIFNVKQKDKNSVGLNVYKRIINKEIASNESLYTFVGKIDASFGEDFKRFIDNESTINDIIYRFVPYSKSGLVSSEFSSVVVKTQSPKLNFSKKINKKNNFSCLLFTLLSNAIEIEIREIPPGPISLLLLRKRLDNFEKKYTIISNQVFLNSRGSEPIKILDNNVKKHSIYEYIIKYFYKDGSTEIGSNNLIVEYNPTVENIVSTTTTNPVVINQSTDVNFTLTSVIVQKNIDFVKKALQNQGLYSDFQGDIINNRESLQNILGYRILRANISTGEMEDFGTTTDIDFSDKKLGSLKGAKSLKAGNKYRYIIFTHFRNPETTIPTFRRTVQTSINKTYQLNPSKWLHPVVLNEGSIVSSNSLTRNHSKSDFTFGPVGDITTVDISLSDTLPSLFDAKAQKIGKNKILVQWKVQGIINKIDHFIIILEMLGMKTIVGKCHNVSSTNYFQFIDSLDNGEIGVVSYYITPVYYDYGRGTEIKTNKVVI